MQRGNQYSVITPLMLIWLCCWNLSCGGGGGGPTNRPPEVRNTVVDRAELDFEGGVVTITAQASDPDGDELTVQARVKRPDGTVQTVTLAKISGSEYRGTYTVPGNPTTSSQKYEVQVMASDGQVSAADLPLSFTVNPAETPPEAIQF